jgi:hypothetical protein
MAEINGSGQKPGNSSYEWGRKRGHVKSFEVKEQNVFVEWLKALFGAVAA